ncbi:uncharacterized, partial [Tachysurus ichikawai]
PRRIISVLLQPYLHGNALPLGTIETSPMLPEDHLRYKTESSGEGSYCNAISHDSVESADKGKRIMESWKYRTSPPPSATLISNPHLHHHLQPSSPPPSPTLISNPHLQPTSPQPSPPTISTSSLPPSPPMSPPTISTHRLNPNTHHLHPRLLDAYVYMPPKIQEAEHIYLIQT